MRMQPSFRVLLLLLLTLLTGSAAAMGLGKGHVQRDGECLDPQAAECDPDFDEELALVPHNYDFGGVPVGAEALPMSYALVNTSGGAVQVGTIAVSAEGLNTCMAIGCPVLAANEFFLLTDECSGLTLNDQESCELEVGFLPATEGEFASALWVPYTPTGGELTTIRGKLAGGGFVEDGSGFVLSGAIYLFEQPSAETVLDRIHNRANDAAPGNARQGGVPANPKPKVHSWQPVAGVTMILDNGLTTQTNEVGEYHFDGLQKGSYTVTPQSDLYRFFPAVRHTRVTGRDRLGIEFRARELPPATE